MNQNHLDDIFKKCTDGNQVEGWGWGHHGDIDTLVHLTDGVWARQHPKGQWIKIPGMAGNA